MGSLVNASVSNSKPILSYTSYRPTFVLAACTLRLEELEEKGAYWQPCKRRDVGVCGQGV